MEGRDFLTLLIGLLALVFAISNGSDAALATAGLAGIALLIYSVRNWA